MPNIKSAKKKMRQDIRREDENSSYKKSVVKMMKNMSKIKGKSEAAKEVSKAYMLIDKAAKKNVIHANKAARLKSQVSRLANAVA